MGMPRTVETLLRHGADPSLPTQHSRSFDRINIKATPLVLAQRGGNNAVIGLLTAARPVLSPVEAAATGNVSALRKHLNAGTSPNEKDEAGTPFLVLAVASGKVDAVRLLLDHKADPNAVSNRRPNPETALTRAVAAAQPEVVALLLKRGADLSTPGNRDALVRLIQTAGCRLPLRRTGQDDRFVKGPDALLAAQNHIYSSLIGRVDVRKTGGAALCAAVERAQFGVAQDLIRRGADVNARDRDGKTVTMLALETLEVSANNAEATRFLRLLKRAGARG